jgi:hypothetical protein
MLCMIRTHGDVGVDDHVIAIFCILDHSGIVGLKLPETNITWSRSQDFSHTWHVLAYVALRVHVSPAIVMIYFTKSC